MLLPHGLGATSLALLFIGGVTAAFFIYVSPLFSILYSLSSLFYPLSSSVLSPPCSTLHPSSSISTSRSENFSLLNLRLTSYPQAFTVAIYRLYFHPLAKYPGPFLAKITDWHQVYHAYRGDRHLEFWRAHEKYGKITHSSLPLPTISKDARSYSSKANSCASAQTACP